MDERFWRLEVLLGQNEWGQSVLISHPYLQAETGHPSLSQAKFIYYSGWHPGRVHAAIQDNIVPETWKLPFPSLRNEETRIFLAKDRDRASPFLLLLGSVILNGPPVSQLTYHSALSVFRHKTALCPWFLCVSCKFYFLRLIIDEFIWLCLCCYWNSAPLCFHKDGEGLSLHQDG